MDLDYYVFLLLLLLSLLYSFVRVLYCSCVISWCMCVCARAFHAHNSIDCWLWLGYSFFCCFYSHFGVLTAYANKTTTISLCLWITNHVYSICALLNRGTSYTPISWNGDSRGQRLIGEWKATHTQNEILEWRDEPASREWAISSKSWNECASDHVQLLFILLFIASVFRLSKIKWPSQI